jgi:hypothetical protein
VVGLERGGEHVGRVNPEAREEFRVRPSNPGRRLPEAFSVGVLADCDQNLADRAFNTTEVDGPLNGDTVELPVDQSGCQVVEDGVVVRFG